nr:MAG TPA: hypothetical protein [Caudoviricetes sp.]
MTTRRSESRSPQFQPKTSSLNMIHKKPAIKGWCSVISGRRREFKAMQTIKLLPLNRFS